MSEPEKEPPQPGRRLQSRPTSRPLWVFVCVIVFTAAGVAINLTIGRKLASFPTLPLIAWIAIATGPLLALTSVIYAAFKYPSHDQEGAPSPGEPSYASKAIFWSGILLLAVASILGIGLSLSTTGWILVLLLEIAGVGATVAATELTLRPGAAIDNTATRAATRLEEQVRDWRLRGIYQDVTVAAIAYRKSAKQWTLANYSLGSLAAIFSGGSGIAGLSSAPTAVKTIFAVLAVLGAALASLNTSLGANEAQAESKLTATKLEALAREIRWAGTSTGDHPPTEKYVTEFNNLTTAKPKE